MKKCSQLYDEFPPKVALVYQADDPIGFMSSFYGCITSGVIPVPVEPPGSKDVSFTCDAFCLLQFIEQRTGSRMGVKEGAQSLLVYIL